MVTAYPHVIPRSATTRNLRQRGQIQGEIGDSSLAALVQNDMVGNYVFSINGQQVTRVSDPDYASGEVGFFVEMFDETLAHIHYDALVIRELEADAIDY